jgi:NACHT-associated inactive Restriction Endonuclease 2
MCQPVGGSGTAVRSLRKGERDSPGFGVGRVVEGVGSAQVRLGRRAVAEVDPRGVAAREFRWVGDTEIGADGSGSVRTITRSFTEVHGLWPPPDSKDDTSPGRRFKDHLDLPRPPQPDDLLARLKTVCEVKYPSALVERIDPGPGRPQGYLRVTKPGTPQIMQYPVGAHEGTITQEVVAAFLTEVDARHRCGDSTMNSILVYNGPQAPEELRIWAGSRGVRPQSLLEFQGLYDLSPYADRQAERLVNSDIYPPALYVPQRFSLITRRGQAEPIEQDLLSRLRQWVADPQGRFIVVLGDFGHGKTFLLRELTRRIHQEQMPPVVPIFIQLRDLEKKHTLEELLAAQLTAGGEEVIDHRRLRYKLDGTVDGAFWWTVNLCTFAPGELDLYTPGLRRLPPDTPLAELNRTASTGEER